MEPDIDFEALSGASSTAALHGYLAGVDPVGLRLSDLVRLKAVYAARIQADRDLSVDIPATILDSYHRLLTDRPLRLRPFAPRRSGMRRVSLLTSIYTRGTHLGALGSFVGFLVSVPELDRIDVVFSAEQAPQVWADGLRNRCTTRLTEALKTSIARFHGAGRQAFSDKLHIVVAPEEAQLAEAIGDVVIRYEGTVPRNQYRLCTRSIFAQRPVLATVGSSLVTQVSDTDLLLTPADRGCREGEVRYLRPLPRFRDTSESLAFRPPAEGAKVLLTGYAGDKLARGLTKLGEADWHATADLFRRVPEMRWHLFGAKDTEAVWRAFPGAFKSAFPSRITVDGVLDLTDVLTGGFALLALPGVGGSGTIAKLALNEAVPVLVCRNNERDISNMFPHPAPIGDFPKLVGLLSDWTLDDGKRAEYLAHQLADMNIRADLPEKSAELSALLSRAIQVYLRRASGSDPRQGDGPGI